jgi:hypothetical protein
MPQVETMEVETMEEPAAPEPEPVAAAVAAEEEEEEEEEAEEEGDGIDTDAAEERATEQRLADAFSRSREEAQGRVGVNQTIRYNQSDSAHQGAPFVLTIRLLSRSEFMM